MGMSSVAQHVQAVGHEQRFRSVKVSQAHELSGPSRLVFVTSDCGLPNWYQKITTIYELPLQ